MVTSVIVKFYETPNDGPRWRKVLNLYRLNRRRLGRWRSLRLALRRELMTTAGLTPRMIIDNLGLTVESQE